MYGTAFVYDVSTNVINFLLDVLTENSPIILTVERNRNENSTSFLFSFKKQTIWRLEQEMKMTIIAFWFDGSWMCVHACINVD